MREKLIAKLEKVEKIASASRVTRLLNNPLKYVSAILFKDFLYNKLKKEKQTSTNVFWGERMRIALPAATDIYLTGGKSHSSEIRLAKFIVKTLGPGDHFLDIGAHYGYFTLLSSLLVEKEGKVCAFEPSVKNYGLLEQNCKSKENVSIHRDAVSDRIGTLSFYEFDNLHSEYNSIDFEQFKQEEWYANAPPEKIEVPATTIDSITSKLLCCPKLIKIDVEGGEYDVIKGGLKFIQQNNPIIAMEYLAPQRHNKSHQDAVQLLRQNNYQSYVINSSGLLIEISNIDYHLTENQLESDNIIFKKHNKA